MLFTIKQTIAQEPLLSLAISLELLQDYFKISYSAYLNPNLKA